MTTMQLKREPELPISADLLEAIKTFPVQREVSHCGRTLTVSALEFYADCPTCQKRIKVRSLTAVPEIEDVLDAVCEWLMQPGAAEVMRRRQEVIAEDRDED